MDGGSSDDPDSSGTVKQKRSVSAVAYSNSVQSFKEEMGW